MAGRQAAKAVNQAAKAAEAKADGQEIYLDPKLAEIRDAEIAKLNGVQVEPRPDATLDPALAKQRDAAIAKGDRVVS